MRIELTSAVLETTTLPLSYGHIGDTRIFTVVHHHVPTSRREWESNPHALARRLFSKQLPPPIGWPLQVSQRIARSVCNDLRALPDILCNQSRLGAQPQFSARFLNYIAIVVPGRIELPSPKAAVLQTARTPRARHRGSHPGLPPPVRKGHSLTNVNPHKAGSQHTMPCGDSARRRFTGGQTPTDSHGLDRPYRPSRG